MLGHAERRPEWTMVRTLGTQKNVFSDFSALYEGQASYSLFKASDVYAYLFFSDPGLGITPGPGFSHRGREGEEGAEEEEAGDGGAEDEEGEAPSLGTRPAEG